MAGRVALLGAVAASLVLAAPAAARPNVIVIETDDQTADSLYAMPSTRALIAEPGVTFANSFVSMSQCCPSRAVFQTGQYAHNNHVLNNAAPEGGYDAFAPEEENAIACWLRDAGVRTYLGGKYMNGWNVPARQSTYRPAGPTSRACSTSPTPASTSTPTA